MDKRKNLHGSNTGRKEKGEVRNEEFGVRSCSVIGGFCAVCVKNLCAFRKSNFSV